MLPVSGQSPWGPPDHSHHPPPDEESMRDHTPTARNRDASSKRRPVSTHLAVAVAGLASSGRRQPQRDFRTKGRDFTMPANFRNWMPVLTVLFLSCLGRPVLAQPTTEATVRDGPRLILEDSLVLRESGDFYAGQPSMLLVAADSSYFVVDTYSARVLRFDASGRPIRAYGRRGEGPGEFLNIMGVASFVHDDVLAVADGRPPISMELELFGVDSGEHLGQVSLDGVVTALAVEDERLWAGGMDIDQWNALGSAPWGRLSELDDVDGPIISLDQVPVPRPYVDNRQIMIMGGLAVMDVGQNDVLISFRTSPYILRVSHDGHVVDTIPLRQRERRGVPADDEFISMATLPASASPEQTQEFHTELDRSVSLLLQVSRDTAGRIFTVHADVERVGRRDFAGVLYVSSMTGDGATQCSDTFVPASDAAFPVAVLRGSNLYVLDQRIASGGAGDVRTVVRKFAVDPDRCDGQIESRGSMVGR